MIIVLKPGVTQKQVEDFSRQLESQNGVKVNAWYGEHSTVLGLLGDTAAVDIEYIGAQDIVQSVKRVQEPYKKANRKFHPDDTVIDLGHGSAIGGGKLGIIAGPCSVESEEQILSVASDVKASAPLSCVAAAFKPRTSPYAFQGLRAEGLELLAACPQAHRPADRHRNHVGQPHGAVRGRGHYPSWRPQHAEF